MRFGYGGPGGSSSLPSRYWARSITPSASTPYCTTGILKSPAIQISCFLLAFPLTCTSSWGKPESLLASIRTYPPPPPSLDVFNPGVLRSKQGPLPAKYHFRLLGHGSAGLSLTYMRAPTTFRPDVGVAGEPLLL